MACNFIPIKKYPEAIASFKRAMGYSPTSSTAINAYDYMAKSYSQLGDSHAAIETYKKSIATDLNRDATHTALANIYYSQGDYGAALKEYAAAAKLNTYLYGKTRPAMTATGYTALGTPFLTVLGPGTKLTALGNYNLASPGAQQTFSLTFQFSKPMAVESVQKVQNWTISRSDSSTGLSGDYNFGMPVPATETLLSYHPSAVIYDQNAMTATVLFAVTQNSTVDGTIDPSHIQFGFNGKDTIGLSMDTKADQYTGFSGFA